ncbi:MAG: hypothetical protein AAGC67_04350 [Myxococcota bacterium]
MSADPPNSEEAASSRPKWRRRMLFLALGAYLVVLAISPQVATLGFKSRPTADPAVLRAAERERFQPVSWDVLSGFPYDFETFGTLEDASPASLAERHRSLLPLEVRALDGHPIAVRGYVIPVAFADGRVTEFILAAKNEIGCCFGDGLSMNQWIQVAVPQQSGFDFEPMAIATVTGLLEVGEDVRDGIVFSLYRMRDASVRAG